MDWMRTDRPWNTKALSRTSSDTWEMRLPRSLRNTSPYYLTFFNLPRPATAATATATA